MLEVLYGQWLSVLLGTHCDKHLYPPKGGWRGTASAYPSRYGCWHGVWPTSTAIGLGAGRQRPQHLWGSRDPGCATSFMNNGGKERMAVELSELVFSVSFWEPRFLHLREKPISKHQQNHRDPSLRWCKDPAFSAFNSQSLLELWPNKWGIFVTDQVGTRFMML